MRRLKQVVVGLVWCVVSVGCVAEEVKSSAPDSGFSVNTNELTFSGIVKKVVYDCKKDGICLVYVDDIAVSFSPKEDFGLGPTRGRFYWPFEINAGDQWGQTRLKFHKYSIDNCVAQSSLTPLIPYRDSSSIFSRGFNRV